MRQPARHVHAPRRGVTLIEVLVAITLTLIGFGIAMPFFFTQSRAVTGHAGRLDAQLNINFALAAIDRDLRVAGVGVVLRQPLLVQAASNAITFNSDLNTLSGADFAAVYYDPDQPANSVSLLTPANKVTLPNSSWMYPDSMYYTSPGVPSAAETISYWVESDPQASGLYRVMRRVNDAPPRVVSRGIKLVSGQPFFRYFKLAPNGTLLEINQALLPMRHLNGYHGGPADTANSARVDSIRLVRVKFTSVHRDPRYGDVQRVEEGAVRITNAGLILASTCGDTPLSVPSVTATPAATPPRVTLTWPKSIDESAAEKDVERYSIFRRAAGPTVFEEPIASVSAGLPSYAFTDTDVISGQQWVYGVAALDCTPALSGITASGTVTVP
jgi:prepilin-type N-terminal cleavage/methylation domain-containing protein